MARDANGDADESTVRETPIFAHMANDGLPFCMCGVDLYRHNIDIETVENEFYSTDGSNTVIENLTPEDERGDADPPQVGTLTFSEDSIENIEISLPDGDTEYLRDSDGWPTRDSGVPWGSTNARSVLVLTGNAIVHEDEEGPSRRNFVIANERYGPNPRFDPYNDGSDAVATFKAITPTEHTVYVRASDVARVQTPTGETIE